MCPRSGHVVIVNSELMAGQIGKKTLGDGSKSGLVYTALRQYGCLQAAKVINRLSKLCARWLGGHRGFSIGIEDVTPSAKLIAKKAELLKEAEVVEAHPIKKRRRDSGGLKCPILPFAGEISYGCFTGCQQYF